jgi:hypothetical protein
MAKLKHMLYKVDLALYFYDGEVPVVDGVAEIPDDRPEWCLNAYHKGYRLDAETGAEVDPNVWIEALDPQSAKSAGVKSESTDSGRQPILEDGVRSIAQDGDGSLSEQGLGSGNGDGAADSASEDRPARKAVRTKK